MQTLQINPKSALIFGLAWRAYDPYESRHRQITEWQQQGFTWSSSYSLGTDTYVGLCDENFERPSKGALYSGAALIAKHKRLIGRTSLILLEATDEVCVVGIIEGCVVIDVCVHHDEVVSQRNAFAQRCTESGKTFETFGLLESSQELGNLDHHIEWDDIVSMSPFTAVSTKAKLDKFKSDRSAWLLIGFLTLIALGFAASAFSTYLSNQERQRQIDAVAAANDPHRLYEEAIQKVLSDPKVIAPLGASLLTLRAELGQLPMTRGGWRLEKIACEIAQSQCVAEWSLDQSKIGTYADFMNEVPSMPQKWKHTLGPSIGKISSVAQIEIPRSSLPEKSTWVSSQEFLKAVASNWQKAVSLGFAIEVKEPTPQALVSNLPAAAAEVHPSVIHASQWALTGRPWWLSEVLDSAPKYMTLDRLILQNNGKEFSFSAEGKVYVRKS